MFPEVDRIETPENVYLERDLAGIGLRFISCLIDFLLIFLISLVLGVVISIAMKQWPDELLRSREFSGSALLIIVNFLLFWGYFAFFELKNNGQTPGKKHQKIRVVKENGAPVTFSAVAIRNLFRVIDIPIGLFCMFMTKKWQRLGDLAAGTVVVSEAPLDYSSTTKRSKQAHWQHETSAEALASSGLSPQEFNILTNYWMRRHELTLEARRKLLKTLVGPILERQGLFLRGQPLTAIEYHVEQMLRIASSAAQQAPDKNEKEASTS